MLRPASHAATEGVFVQQSVLTSSPPRWTKLSLNTPGEGLPGAEAMPPVTYEVISSNMLGGASQTVSKIREDVTVHNIKLHPVTSFKSPSMRSNVAFVATLSGCVHVALGQISG